nr:hypothetical protein [uncultured Oscillibacter sp.]
MEEGKEKREKRVEKWEKGGSEIRRGAFILGAIFGGCVKNRQNAQNRNAGFPAIIRKVIEKRRENLKRRLTEAFFYGMIPNGSEAAAFFGRGREGLQ